MKLKYWAFMLASFWFMGSAQAQSWNLVFGLSQPLILNGGNVEVNYLTDHWVFEYSHGFNLDLNASPDEQALSDSERSQGLKIKVPYSTGGGIGYRFTPAFNLRLEFKQHEFQVTHPSGEEVTYTTQDLGLGAYYFYKPFKGLNFVVIPSIRYWPTINTSLSDDRYTFRNGDVHKAHDFGLFANVSMGWSF
jgi:hypothetical protein